MYCYDVARYSTALQSFKHGIGLDALVELELLVGKLTLGRSAEHYYFFLFLNFKRRSNETSMPVDIRDWCQVAFDDVDCRLAAFFHITLVQVSISG